ncbi:MAG: glycosyltransferase family 4 protein [Anaerolineae bacterium]
MKLLYVANIRLPTEKAHGLQIVQNCEAFADARADVTLWIAQRINAPALRGVHDIWAHYAVEQNFALRRLPCIDLMPLVPERTDRLAQLIFLIQLWTFALAALVAALFTSADLIYSRDELILFLLSFVKPRRMLAYEAHTLAPGRGGSALQRRVVRRVGHVIAVTRKLADDLIALGADPDRIMVAHDGIRRARFADLPDKAAARREIGWSDDAFIVGYVGRLQTMAMDKGVGALVEALAKVGGCSLALVGGPDDTAEEFRQRWIELGQDEARFLYAGQVAPERVPLYLSAFDVCAMPFPWTPHFAYYASPIKLFEYMASRRPLIASNLPSIAEVVVDGESALLIPPADADALADAIRRLRDDPALAQRLADAAYALVMERYTWDARAKAILAGIQDAG